MNTLNIISDINTYLKTDNKAILTELLKSLQIEYRHEEQKRNGGNVALKRQKIIERILKQNEKDMSSIPQFHKAWMEKINGEDMQIIGNPYFIFAFNQEHQVLTDTEVEAKNIFKASNFFDRSQHNLNICDYDIVEIKQYISDWKTEQKQKPPKQRKSICVIPIGNSGYNAEYFVNCIEALGNDVVFYQNENPKNISFFENESGQALLMPCRL